MSKPFSTNFIAFFLILISYFTPYYSHYFLYVGLFALSGAITNQLAIHMLFERVPYIYGSGVIEKNFGTFKISIKTMIMEQFFTKEHLSKFFESEEKKINLVPLVEKADFSSAFDALSKTVMESKFGAAIGMFGGEEALDALREPFASKLKRAVGSIVSSSAFKNEINQHLQESALSDDIMDSLEALIASRIEELSPNMIKVLVQELIKEHLGWLVVWGGVFGGLIGFISSLLLSNQI